MKQQILLVAYFSRYRLQTNLISQNAGGAPTTWANFHIFLITHFYALCCCRTRRFAAMCGWAPPALKNNAAASQSTANFSRSLSTKLQPWPPTATSYTACAYTKFTCFCSLNSNSSRAIENFYLQITSFYSILSLSTQLLTSRWKFQIFCMWELSTVN